MKEYKFTFTLERQGTTVTYETDAILSSHLCNEFQNFLSGCGYKFTTDEEIVVWDHSLTNHIVEEL